MELLHFVASFDWEADAALFQSSETGVAAGSVGVDGDCMGPYEVTRPPCCSVGLHDLPFVHIRGGKTNPNLHDALFVHIWGGSSYGSR